MKSALKTGTLLAWLLASVLVLFLGASTGSTGWALPWTDLSELGQRIFFELRLPRTLGAWLAGALLGVSGAIAQGLFRNPLAEPYLLGGASGAALGVALALVMAGLPSLSVGSWFGHFGITLAAFLGSLLAFLLTLGFAKGRQHGFNLLLSGVVVGVVLGAFASTLSYFAPEILPGLQAYTLGTTAFVSWHSCLLMACALLVCLLVSWGYASVLDGLGLGQDTAASLGVGGGGGRMALLCAMALATAAAVAQTGLIGFIGLAAPHMLRQQHMLKHRTLLGMAALAGGLLLSAADVLSRALFAPIELPVGLLTALLGGAYLLFKMQTSGRSHER